MDIVNCKNCGRIFNYNIGEKVCPECKKKLTMRTAKSGKIYTCICGYKEGEDAFNKRMKKAKSAGGKRDFIAYQKKQAAEEKKKQAENNPFAQALKGLKLD